MLTLIPHQFTIPPTCLRHHTGNCPGQEDRLHLSQDRTNPLANSRPKGPSRRLAAPTRHPRWSNISSSAKLRWLGYWFVPNISSSPQFSRPLALSQAPLAPVHRLSWARGDIPPYLCHCLAYSLLFPIVFYAADLFVPTKGLLSKMDVHWRKIQ